MFGGKRQSVASKFDAVHHLSVHQQISLLNFYQFLQKEFPLSLISRQKGKKDAKTRIQDSNVCLAFGVWPRAAKVKPFNVF